MSKISSVLDTVGAVLAIGERVESLRESAKSQTNGTTALQLRVEALELETAELRENIAHLSAYVQPPAAPKKKAKKVRK